MFHSIFGIAAPEFPGYWPSKARFSYLRKDVFHTNFSITGPDFLLTRKQNYRCVSCFEREVGVTGGASGWDRRVCFGESCWCFSRRGEGGVSVCFLLGFCVGVGVGDVGGGVVVGFGDGL